MDTCYRFFKEKIIFFIEVDNVKLLNQMKVQALIS